jgi:hypothetical protein
MARPSALMVEGLPESGGCNEVCGRWFKQGDSWGPGCITCVISAGISRTEIRYHREQLMYH